MGNLNPERLELDRNDQLFLDLFNSISRLRFSGINGPDPIQPDQVQGWMLIHGVQLLTNEIDLLLELDAQFLDAMAKQQKWENPTT